MKKLHPAVFEKLNHQAKILEQERMREIAIAEQELEVTKIKNRYPQ
jgi:hypothetical protein